MGWNKSCFIVSILQRSQLEISNLVRILRYCCACISFNENTGFIIEDERASNHLSPWMFQFKLQVISLFIFNLIFMWCMSNNSTSYLEYVIYMLSIQKIGHLMFLKSNKKYHKVSVCIYCANSLPFDRETLKYDVLIC